jgi:hypothetical protein
MQDLESRVQLLEAREAIKELRIRYAWHAARADIRALVDTFTDDGVFEMLIDGARRRLVGHGMIHKHMSGSLYPGKMLPLIHNDLIEVDGEVASGTCLMTSRATPQHPGSEIYYRDSFRRLNTLWLFTERLVYSVGPESEL